MGQSLTITKYPDWFNHYRPHLPITSPHHQNKILFLFNIYKILYKNFKIFKYSHSQTQIYPNPFSLLGVRRHRFLSITGSRYRQYIKEKANYEGSYNQPNLPGVKIR